MKFKYLLALVLSIPTLLAAQERLTLEDAIRMGMQNNYGVEISQISTHIAQETNTWGMAGALPSISLSGTLSTQYDTSTEASTSPAQLSANLNWTLFSGFAVKANKAMFNNREQRAQGNEMLYLENLVHSIINSYYYVRLQRELLDVTSSLVSISKDRYEQTKVASSIGSGGKYEQILAQNSYLTDQSSYLRQENLYRESVHNLNLLLSCDPQTQWIFDDSIDIPSAMYGYDEMVTKMLSNNKTLKNQYIDLKSRDIEIDQKLAALYPSIGLVASVAGGDNSLAHNTSKGYIRPQVGVSLSYNLFNGGRNRTNISIAKITKEMEEVETSQMELELTKELATQLDGYDVYRNIVELQNQQLQVATTLLNLSQERYRNGTINSFSFREVQLSYLRSASDRLNSIYNLVVANSQLLRLTGGILTQ